jgi:hypothetical protein
MAAVTVRKAFRFPATAIDFFATLAEYRLMNGVIILIVFEHDVFLSFTWPYSKKKNGVKQGVLAERH